MRNYRTFRAIFVFIAVTPIIIRYGWLLSTEKLGRRRSLKRWTKTHEFAAKRIESLCVKLGGLFIKLAQVMASRQDVMPEPFIRILAKFHDEVPPRPLAELVPTIESSLGRSVDQVFASIDETPLGAASLAQVHRATLCDGRDVVIKIQYPEAQRLFGTDLGTAKILSRVANVFPIPVDYASIIDEVTKFISLELDFQREAEATKRIAQAFSGVEEVVIPEIIDDACADRVIVMTYLDGIQVTRADKLRKAGHDLKEISEKIAGLYTVMIFEHKYFHGDPHPGNLLVMSNGAIGMLDFGLVKELPANFSEGLMKMIVGVFSGELEDAIDAAESIGFEFKKRDPEMLRQLMNDMLGQDTSDDSESAHDIGDIPFTRMPEDIPLILRAIVLLNGLSEALTPGMPLIPSAIVQQVTGIVPLGGFKKRCDFLSSEWFSELDRMKKLDQQPEDPVVNLIISGSPFGEVKAHLVATAKAARFLAGHHANADATATVPYKWARDIFVDGTTAEANFAVLHGGILGHIQIEGDYSVWAMTANVLNGILVQIRITLKLLTKSIPVQYLSTKAAEAAAINNKIERLGLQKNVREMNEQGYTLLTPDETGITANMMDRALDYIVNKVTEITGVRPDMKTGLTHQDVFYPVLWYSILKDKVFQDMATNEYVLALTSHLFGSRDFRLSTDDVLMKGPTARDLKVGNMQLGLHLDSAPYGFDGIEEPLPDEVVSVNALWLMTDFTEEADGVTVFIPGSHKFGRWPKDAIEGQEYAVPILAPRGSFLVWPGTTWHGALPRTNSGMRVAMTIQYCARHVHPRNPYQFDVTEDVLRQNSPRFAQLVGLTDNSGWREEGIYAQLHERARAGAHRYSKTPTTCSMSLESVMFERKKSRKAI